MAVFIVYLLKSLDFPEIFVPKVESPISLIKGCSKSIVSKPRVKQMPYGILQ